MKKYLLLLVAVMMTTLSFAGNPLQMKRFAMLPEKPQMIHKSLMVKQPMNSKFMERKANPVKQPMASKAAPAKVPAIIDEQPEGTLKTYTREDTGKFFYRSSGTYQVYSQEGSMKIVYDADGTTVYLADPICYASQGAWVKGTISGNTITVPLGQYISYNTTYLYGKILAMINVTVTDGELNTYEYDNTATEVTYTINEGTITLNGTSDTRVFGAVWDDDFTFAGGEYNTTLTEFTPDEPDKTVPPDDLKSVPTKFVSYSYADDDFVVNDVEAGIYENSYFFVKGIDSDLPEDWVYGEINPETGQVIFAPQYIGLYDQVDLHYLIGIGFEGNDAVIGNIVFNLSKSDDGTFILVQDEEPSSFYGISKSDEAISLVNYGYYATIHNVKPIEEPAGLDMKLYIFNYQKSQVVYEEDGETPKTDEKGNYIYEFVDATKNIYFGILDGKAYIKGMANAAGTDGLMVGSVSGSTITFATPQVFNEDADAVLVGWDSTNGVVTDKIVFDYDATTGFIAQQGETGLLVNYATFLTSYYWENIYHGQTAEFEEEVVTPPAEATEWGYVASALVTDVASYQRFDYNKPIDAKYVANGETVDLYLKGIFPEMPDAWVKATMTQDGITIPTGQYLGKLEGTPQYFFGLNVSTYAAADVVLTKAVDYVYQSSVYSMMSTSKDTPTGMSYFYSSLAINEYGLYSAVTLPDGAETVEYTMTAKMGDTDITGKVNVAVVGNDVYVQNILNPLVEKVISEYPLAGYEMLNNAWLKGTKTETGFTLSLQSINQTFDYLFNVGFTYNAEENSYSASGLIINENTAALYPLIYVTNVVLAGEGAGINALTADKLQKSEGAWYTINGQRVAQPTQKGLYIHNGRKVVIK